MQEANHEYLGDGVYIHNDGHGGYCLTTGNHDPSIADNIIYLEKEVISNLRNRMMKDGLLG